MPGDKRFERYAHSRAIAAVNNGLSRLYRGAFFVAHLDAAKGWLELIGEPEHDLLRCRRDCASNRGARAIEVSMWESRACSGEKKYDG